MLIYNTTYHCENSCYDEFIHWIKTIYIPQALKNNELSDPRISRIMTQETTEGVSISVQFSTQNLDTLSTWYNVSGAPLVEMLTQKFGQRVAGFSTIMEQIEL